MYRALALTLALLSFAQRASAHGSPPVATELLAHSAEGVTLVRLAPGGLAQRVPEGFRFLCPEAWGGDVLAPAAAIPAGPALIASDTLFVVEPEGRVSPHPIQTGTGVVVTSNKGAVFGVFKHDGKYELRRVTGTTNDLVRVLEQPFGALVATDGEIALLRWLGSTLEVQRIALTGELLASVTWNVPNAVAYARLRAVGNTLYAVVWGRSAPWVTLGRVADAGCEPLREANTEIAGPLALDAGTIVALDNALVALESGAPIETHGNRVTCLGAADGLPYACAHGDLISVDPSAFGSPLFELRSLREPDYQALPEANRLDCTTRWLDLRDDVAAAMASGMDASVSIADAGTDGPDTGRSAATTPASASKQAGCSLGPADGAGNAPYMLTLALTLAMRRRSRRGASPRA